MIRRLSCIRLTHRTCFMKSGFILYYEAAKYGRETFTCCKTLKKCDSYSSAVGSIVCYMGSQLCLGTPNNNKCGPQDYCTGDLYGSNVWYYTLSRDVFSKHNTLSKTDAFSARCVRGLKKSCLSIW